MRIAAIERAAAVAAAANQAGDLDPRHHHRVPLPHGGDGAGGGGGEADEQHHQNRLLQLHHQHQEAQQQEAPSVPVFQLQHLQAAALRQRPEYALLAPMGDSSGHHHHDHHGGGGFQPQLLSFGGVSHLHQFTAQAAPASGTHSRSRTGVGGGEIVASQSSSRVRSSGGGGEIVAVQGGHIVRSTGRKDRHSKVCTARGPRDRRVRLSAHTAIQFYDVQDRLGYDRPSKAVDWLIKNAKDAIDKLETLPAWHPTTNATNANPSSSTHPADSADNNSDDQAQAITVAHPGSFDFPAAGAAAAAGATSGGFLPSSLDSDSIADTIKSFFPMGGTAGEASSSAAGAQSSAMGVGGFQSYTPDLLSRTGSHSHQELRLSLQSTLPDPPMSFHSHSHSQQQEQDRSHGGNGSAQLFPGYSFGGGAMWAETSHQRMLPWSVPADPGGGGGYLFNVSQQAALTGGQSQQFLFQRGPLQSSNNNQPSDQRGWPEAVEPDNPMFGFSGFRIPARIQGDEDHNGGGGNNADKPPPSVSSASHH